MIHDHSDSGIARAQTLATADATALGNITNNVGVANAADDLMAILNRNAAAEDAGTSDISASVAVLVDAGWHTLVLPPQDGGDALCSGGLNALASVRTFIKLGEANLSVARLFEGHVNAVQLLSLYADEELQQEAFEAVRQGAFLGVWGADANAPVRLSEDGNNLNGSKRFASGLGVLSHAVITVNSGPQVRLCLVPVNEMNRQNADTWTMSGMKATASGDYDFTGVNRDTFEFFGTPGCYLEEPWFVGGVWRIAAIQLGGALGLLNAARSRLDQIGRLKAEAQIARLAAVLKSAFGAIGLVERAARYAGSQSAVENPERAVALSILARMLTEEVGQNAVTAVERSIGLQHFEAGTETGRIARDLNVYMRQATGDAFLQRAGVTMLSSPGPLSDAYYD